MAATPSRTRESRIAVGIRARRGWRQTCHPHHPHSWAFDGSRFETDERILRLQAREEANRRDHPSEFEFREVLLKVTVYNLR